MVARLSAMMGTIVAVALVVAGLWGWGASRELVAHADKPELALWSVRAAAIAALAAAQVLGLTYLAGNLYRGDRTGEALRFAAGMVCTVALLGALALGVMSR